MCFSEDLFSELGLFFVIYLALFLDLGIKTKKRLLLKTIKKKCIKNLLSYLKFGKKIFLLFFFISIHLKIAFNDLIQDKLSGKKVLMFLKDIFLVSIFTFISYLIGSNVFLL